MSIMSKVYRDRSLYRQLCERFGETPWMRNDPFNPGTEVEDCYSAHGNAVFSMGECGNREYAPAKHASKTGGLIYGVILGPGARLRFTDRKESSTGEWIPCNQEDVGHLITDKEETIFVRPEELSTHYL